VPYASRMAASTRTPVLDPPPVVGGRRDVFARAGRRTPFEVVTDDGVRLRGDRLAGGPTALVFCHGFLGKRGKKRLVAFQRDLLPWFTVYAFDFRGHGQSTGKCAFGATEEKDVEAVVRRARADGFERVATLGASMGGIAVIRHAGIVGGVDAVVAISTPATWEGHDTEAVRRMIWLTSRRFGRLLLRAAGVRVVGRWARREAPVEVVGRIAPIPLILVHGRDDHYFSEESAWALYRNAACPKRLLIASRFGHAEDGYTAAFADKVAAEIERALEENRV